MAQTRVRTRRAAANTAKTKPQTRKVATKPAAAPKAATTRSARPKRPTPVAPKPPTATKPAKARKAQPIVEDLGRHDHVQASLNEREVSNEPSATDRFYERAAAEK